MLFRLGIVYIFLNFVTYHKILGYLDLIENIFNSLRLYLRLKKPEDNGS